MNFKNIFSGLALCAIAHATQAQCSFNPTISTPDSVLCPGQMATFTTQAYDDYQWFRRVYPDGAPEQIAGATQQTLTVGENDLLFFFWVEATDGSCTEASPEVLIDGHVFLLPFVQHSGDFEFDPDLQAFSICQGDTMFLDFSYPANITWFKNGEPMEGETSGTLAITEPGSYTAEGAPGICPDFILSLGVVIDVVVVNCTSPTRPAPTIGQVEIYPNPITAWLTIEATDGQLLRQVELLTLSGQRLRLQKLDGETLHWISIEGLPSGTYLLRVKTGDSTTMHRVVKQ